MSQQVKSDAPGQTSLSLGEEAATTGKTVEEVIADRMARSGDVLKRWGVTRQPAPPKATVDEAGNPIKPGDRLRRVRGIITTGPGDVSTRHHEYLGEAYLDTHEDARDE